MALTRWGTVAVEDVTSRSLLNDTATTEIYTLSLHDALPISKQDVCRLASRCGGVMGLRLVADQSARTIHHPLDRKSTRLNSSHANISYAVFCLKTKTYKQTVKRNSTNAVLFPHQRPHHTSNY